MFSRVLRLPVMLHLSGTVAAIAALLVVKSRLDASYVASAHPVDYVTGQVSFNADKIMGWYAAMQRGGTLDTYWATQIIDFAFITAVAVTGLMVGAIVARIAPEGSRVRSLGAAIAILAVAGATMDATENLLSFVMLSRADAIPQWLAFFYSAVASLKFALIGLAMLTFVVGSAAALFMRVRSITK